MGLSVHHSGLSSSEILYKRCTGMLCSSASELITLRTMYTTTAIEIAAARSIDDIDLKPTISFIALAILINRIDHPNDLAARLASSQALSRSAARAWHLAKRQSQSSL